MAFFIFIMGTFIVSLCFIILLTSLELNHKERNALNLINKLKLNQKIKQHSAVAITDFFRLICAYKRQRGAPGFGKENAELRGIVARLLMSLKCVNSLRKKKQNYMENDLIKDLIDSNEYSTFYLKELENKQLFMLSKLIQLKEDFRRVPQRPYFQSQTYSRFRTRRSRS